MRAALCTGLALFISCTALAELKEVRVGGEIRIRGRYFGNSVGTGIARETRFPTTTLIERALGPFGLTSVYDADDRGSDFTFVEQRTTLNVTAAFTDHVSSFIELESWGRWGEDFRSNYVTGVDGRAASLEDVEVFQAYIDANEMFGWPLRLRVGRQELVFGQAWLVGSQVSPTLGMSYDAVRLTWSGDDYSLDAWWAKAAENLGGFGQDDVDFYGVWGTYKGWEPLSLSAYYLLVRDSRDIELTNGGLLWEWFEDAAGLDDYDTTTIHTVGVHASGKRSGFDYNLQLAYQWGEADSAGSLYAQSPFTFWGDNEAEYDAWAGDIEVGYTFDTAWSPRVSLGGAYFSGDDNRDIGFLDWLNPFDRPEASLAFNRLYSGQWYVASLDILGAASAMTNFHQVRAGITVNPTDKISAGLSAQYLGVNEPFAWPAGFRVNGMHIGYAPFLSFWTEDASSDLGYVGHLWVRYQYSDDLWVRVGWERVFTGPGIYDGNFVFKNGHELLAGTDDDDMDYIYFDTQVKF